MNEGYDDDSSDKYPKWSNIKSNLNSADDVSGDSNKDEGKNHFIKYKVPHLISFILPTSVTKLNVKLINIYQSWFFDNPELKKEQVIKTNSSGVLKDFKDTKMSLSQIISKFCCISGVFAIGLVLMICMIDDTHSSPEIDISHDTVGNNKFIHRNSRKYDKFESSARTSEELLNDITSYGLERSRFLYEIKEKRIYEHGISLTKSDPAHFVAVFNKQTPRAKELSRYGYATLEASSLITKQ